MPDLLRRLQAYFAGERVSFEDVPLDEDWTTPFQAALAAALRAVPWGEIVSYGELSALAGRARAARAAGTFCAENRFSLFVPCHRVVSAAASAATARSASSTSSGCSRSKARGSMALSDDLRSELAAIAPERGCCRLAEVSALFHSAGSVHLRGRGGSRFIWTSPPRASRGARSRSCASSASTPRSARTAAARSTGRRAISCTSAAMSRRSRSLVEAGVLDARHAPLERPPKRVVGRACCRGAYLRGALLGGGSLSGPRAPHLELRTTSLEGAEFLRSVAAADDVRLGVLDRGRHAVAYAKGSTRSSRC